MGMYNEVFCKCPDCGGTACLQVPQFVLGFGGFNLELPETILELSYEDLYEIKILVQEKEFHCENCNKYFFYKSPNKEDKLEYIKKLFG